MKKTAKTPTDTPTLPEVIHRIIAHHGPIQGHDVVEKGASVGFTNKRSTSSILFNAKAKGTLIKDDEGYWTVPEGSVPTPRA